MDALHLVSPERSEDDNVSMRVVATPGTAFRWCVCEASPWRTTAIAATTAGTIDFFASPLSNQTNNREFVRPRISGLFAFWPPITLHSLLTAVANKPAV